MHDRIQFGRYVVAQAIPSCPNDVYTEFFNLIEAAPKMEHALEQIRAYLLTQDSPAAPEIIHMIHDALPWKG